MKIPPHMMLDSLTGKITVGSMEEAEEAPFVVVVLLTIPLLMPDNHVGQCSMCNRPIQFRPDGAKKPPKVCVDCVVAIAAATRQ